MVSNEAIAIDLTTPRRTFTATHLKEQQLDVLEMAPDYIVVRFCSTENRYLQVKDQRNYIVDYGSYLRPSYGKIFCIDTGRIFWNLESRAVRISSVIYCVPLLKSANLTISRHAFIQALFFWDWTKQRIESSLEFYKGDGPDDKSKSSSFRYAAYQHIRTINYHASPHHCYIVNLDEVWSVNEGHHSCKSQKQHSVYSSAITQFKMVQAQATSKEQEMLVQYDTVMPDDAESCSHPTMRS
ncbi:hypothetical protein BDR07DRAFT_1382288 [Suillus spraguei]|nr:hypothetical protein BDR07DRAFT_1382288 [Suillus spraguei]